MSCVTEQKIVNELLIRWWGTFRDVGTDSQLELVFGADCWEVDPAVLALLGGCELNLEQHSHFRFPPTRLLSVVR